MTAAAKEIGTTQPAISQRIRVLEDAVGGALLDRSGNQLKPTEVGLRFYDDIAPALSSIHSAVERLQSRISNALPLITIAANFGFSHLWLLPRLQELRENFPSLRFHVIPIDQNDTSNLQSIDISIRFDRRSERSETEIMLAPEIVFPVCSPQFASAHNLDKTIKEIDLKSLVLLHMDERNPRWLDWAGWSVLAGYGHLQEATSFTFNNYPLLLNAAIQGQGMTLAWAGLVEKALNEGLLIRFDPQVIREDHGYLLHTRHRNNSLIKPVIEWFKSQFEKDVKY